MKVAALLCGGALVLLAACASSSSPAASRVANPVTTTTTMGVPDTTTASAIPCKSWKDAATAASAVFYANEGHFPTTFTDLITGTPPLLEITERVTVTANTVTGSGWTLTMRGGGARDPETLTCS